MAHVGAPLTFVWPGSPGLLPSVGFTGLLSTRGLATWRKGLHSGKPLTLIPSEREDKAVNKFAVLFQRRRFNSKINSNSNRKEYSNFCHNYSILC